MFRPISEQKKARAVALRIERQLSAPAIAKLVGISNSTAYKVLKSHPWTGRPVHRTDWTVAQVNDLIRLWPSATMAEIRRAISGRTIEAIGRKASEVGVQRTTAVYRRDGAKAHPVIARLEKIRRTGRIKRPVISRRSGIHVNQLCLWALGRRMPKFDKVCDWAEAMGFEIVVRRKS